MADHSEGPQDPGNRPQTKVSLVPPNPQTSLVQGDAGWYFAATPEISTAAPAVQAQDGSTRPPFIYHVTGRTPAERTVPRYKPYKRVVDADGGRAIPQNNELELEGILKQVPEVETQAATGSSQQLIVNSQAGAQAQVSLQPTQNSPQGTYIRQQPTYFAAQPINPRHSLAMVPQSSTTLPTPTPPLGSIAQPVVPSLSANAPGRLATVGTIQAKGTSVEQPEMLKGPNKWQRSDQTAVPMDAAAIRVSPTPIVRAQVLNNPDTTLINHEATKRLAAPRPPTMPSTLSVLHTHPVPSPRGQPSGGGPNLPTVSPVASPSIPPTFSPNARPHPAGVWNIHSPISMNSSLRSLLSSTPDRAPAPTDAIRSPRFTAPQVDPSPQLGSIPHPALVFNQDIRRSLSVPSTGYPLQSTSSVRLGLSEKDLGDGVDEEDEEAIDEEEMISSVYEDNNDARWHKLYGMIRHMATTQTGLVMDVQRLNTHVGDSSKRIEQSGGDGGQHISPPEPPKPINWDQSVVCDTPAGRRARARREVFLASLIRGTLGSMLKRTSNREPLPHPPPSSLRAPTDDNFGIHYDETERSPFNQMAATVVAEKIVRDQPNLLTVAEQQELRTKVTKHIKYLCRRYKDENRLDAEEFNQKRLKRCSAGSRKRQLYESRLQTLDRFPAALGKHRRLIVHLGVDGTSSDEEDHRNPGIYRIKMKPELSTKVTQLKRNLDFVYNLYFKGPGSKGSQVHRRVPSDLVSTRPFTIEQLPVTCVSRSWLKRLEIPEREFFRFQPHKYDYSFPTSLFSFRPTNEEREIVRDTSPA